MLVWRDGLPEPGRPADVVLGQPGRRPTARRTAAARVRRRLVPLAAWRSPQPAPEALLVADAGNHRILRWDVHPEQDRPADAVLGQPDFLAGGEFPYVSQAGRFRFPYAVAAVDGELAVADTANNRVLLYATTPPVHDDLPVARARASPPSRPTERTAGSPSRRTRCAGPTGCTGTANRAAN